MAREIKVPEQPALSEAALIWNNATGKWELAFRTDYKRLNTVTFVDKILFNSSGQAYTSEPFDCAAYKDFLLLIDLDVTGAPTDIVIDVEFSDDRATWYKYMRGPFGDLRYEDSAGDKKECLDGVIRAEYMRVTLTSTGCDGAKTFLMTVKATCTG